MDFPKPGINFRDITPLFLQPDLICSLLDITTSRLLNLDIQIDAIAGLESRGFLLGVGLA